MKYILVLLEKDIKDAFYNGIVFFILFFIFLYPLLGKFILPKLKKGKNVKIALFLSNNDYLYQFVKNKKNLIIIKDKKEMEELLRRGKAFVGVILPENLLRRISAGERPEIKVIVDVTKPFNIGSVIEITKTELDKFLNLLPVRLNIRSFENISISQTFIDLGILIALVGICLILLPVSIVEEKENKTLNALLLTPISETHFLLSKFVLALLLCMITSIFILIFGNVNLGLPLIFIIFLGTICTLNFGIFIGIVFEGQVLPFVISGFVSLIFIMFPLFTINLNGIWQIFKFIPTFPLLDALRKIIFYKENFISIINNILFLGLWILLSFLANKIVLRKVYEH